MLKNSTSICRPKKTNAYYSCDEPEYCNGYSPICPADTSVNANGPCTSLNNEFGICYKSGICMTRSVACKIMSQQLFRNLKYDDSCDQNHDCSIICSDGLSCYNFTDLGISNFYDQGQLCGMNMDQYCSNDGVCKYSPIGTMQNSTANRLRLF
eukprot:NODE_16_length_41655_cov_0.272813.p21 type:complete len:153 gc:universal NODE_16_length_41655_cov_0.272813:29873-30331(+)